MALRITIDDLTGEPTRALLAAHLAGMQQNFTAGERARARPQRAHTARDHGVVGVAGR